MADLRDQRTTGTRPGSGLEPRIIPLPEGHRARARESKGPFRSIVESSHGPEPKLGPVEAISMPGRVLFAVRPGVAMDGVRGRFALTVCGAAPGRRTE